MSPSVIGLIPKNKILSLLDLLLGTSWRTSHLTGSLPGQICLDYAEICQMMQMFVSKIPPWPPVAVDFRGANPIDPHHHAHRPRGAARLRLRASAKSTAAADASVGSDRTGPLRSPPCAFRCDRPFLVLDRVSTVNSPQNTIADLLGPGLRGRNQIRRRRSVGAGRRLPA